MSPGSETGERVRAEFALCGAGVLFGVPTPSVWAALACVPVRVAHERDSANECECDYVVCACVRACERIVCACVCVYVCARASGSVSKSLQRGLRRAATLTHPLCL
jgi:hypothetical protein